ncbi:MAG TPA: hypothetical protein VG963_27370, partial [Polyangiaceae bacterium]|nr:hypothetical protein [Polyangiaceae bacterium]
MGAFGISLPTQWREMSAAEYHIVSPVFGPTLPPRGRILVTNAVGLNRRPFTIPVALLETVGMPLPPPLAEGAPQGVYRTGYVINVGYRYPNLILDQRLLVHEMTHVWQGHNSLLPVSYVIGSVVA